MILSAPEVQIGTSLLGKDYGYEYPLGLKLRPGSADHQKLLTRLRNLAWTGHSAISKRIDRFQETDQVLTTYVPLDQEEERIKSKDSRKPVSIVYPYSLAIMETMRAYFYAALLSGTVFHYHGVGPEDTLGAMLLEGVIDYQVYMSRIKLDLLTFVRDSLAYGFGAGIPDWEVREGEIFSRGFGTPRSQTGIIYEGNSFLNIDPYLILPDPQVPIHKVQRGEFFGWGDPTNYQQKLREEIHDTTVFNVKYLRDVPFNQSIFNNSSNSIRDRSKGGTFRESDIYSPGVDRKDVFDVNLYVDLIPREWGIGQSEYPEKWWFTFSNDAVITRATRLNLPHGYFPVVITAPNTDGYASTPLSHIEALSGLQGTIDFLLNAHIKSVRKNVNNTYVVDPRSINMKDMASVSEQGGGYIRLRRPAFGKGVKDYVMQMPISDVTRANIGDAQFLFDIMQRVSGANDPAMGTQRRGGPERLTQGEHNSVQQGLFTRLELTASMIGGQGLQPLGEMFASHAQKFLSQEQWIQLQGENARLLQSIYGGDGRVLVDPSQLKINYNVRVADGSVPNPNSSSFWMNAFKIIAEHPELQQKFDIGKVFRKIALTQGEKNVDDFERDQPPPQVQQQVMPNEQVQRQVQAGNLVPSREMF